MAPMGEIPSAATCSTAEPGVMAVRRERGSSSSPCPVFVALESIPLASTGAECPVPVGAACPRQQQSQHWEWQSCLLLPPSCSI